MLKKNEEKFLDLFLNLDLLQKSVVSVLGYNHADKPTSEHILLKTFSLAQVKG